MLSLLLLNGGLGRRLGSDQPKQFITVLGRPMLVYSLAAAEQVDEISEIVLNFPDGYRSAVTDILEAFAVKKPVQLLEAGRTRQESVRILLDAASNENVLIHETARPFVFGSDFRKLIDTDTPNVGFAASIPFTVAPVDPIARAVVGSLDRDLLRNIQLPQKFERASLSQAHAWAAEQGRSYTEDSTLLVDWGRKFYYLDGRDSNIKVTTSFDAAVVSIILSQGGESYE